MGFLLRVVILAGLRGSSHITWDGSGDVTQVQADQDHGPWTWAGGFLTRSIGFYGLPMLRGFLVVFGFHFNDPAIVRVISPHCTAKMMIGYHQCGFLRGDSNPMAPSWYFFLIGPRKSNTMEPWWFHLRFLMVSTCIWTISRRIQSECET